MYTSSTLVSSTMFFSHLTLESSKPPFGTARKEWESPLVLQCSYWQLFARSARKTHGALAAGCKRCEHRTRVTNEVERRRKKVTPWAERSSFITWHTFSTLPWRHTFRFVLHTALLTTQYLSYLLPYFLLLLLLLPLSLPHCLVLGTFRWKR